jgi:uncharacterized protein (TIGR03000 family)
MLPELLAKIAPLKRGPIMKRTVLLWAVSALCIAVLGNPAHAGRQHGKSPTVPSAAAPAVEEDYAYGAMASSAEMVLRIPPGAEVWFNGTKALSQTGSVRPFVTPALEPGWDYAYEVRVRWRENGRPVEQTRHILVRAGDRLALNLTARPTKGK